jgi:hypothetical protein
MKTTTNLKPSAKSGGFQTRTIRFFAAGLITLLMSSNLQAQLTHLYNLNGSFADSFGGPALVPAGGTLNATNYSFGANQGLSLSSGLSNNATYSILLDFSFSDLTGFRKIVDFKDRTSDNGLYNLNTVLDFFGAGAAGLAGAFVPNVLERLVITRDPSNQFTGYVNGVQQISFADTASLAVFTGSNSIIQFFIDDNAIAGEASAGLVDRIALYDGALTVAQVRELGVPNEINGTTPRVPDGGSTFVMLSGVVATLGTLKRKFCQ